MYASYEEILEKDQAVWYLQDSLRLDDTPLGVLAIPYSSTSVSEVCKLWNCMWDTSLLFGTVDSVLRKQRLHRFIG